MKNALRLWPRLLRVVRSNQKMLVGLLLVWPIAAFAEWSGGLDARRGRPPPNITLGEALIHSLVVIIFAAALILFFGRDTANGK
jgi:hypothetical protein